MDAPPMNFMGLPPELTERSRARVVVLPVPYERTTTYGSGARRGPEAMIEASRYVEFYDEEMDSDIRPIGFHTAPPVVDEQDGVEAMLVKVREAVGQVLDEGKLPVVLGGEHTVTPPAVEAVLARHPGLSVLQIDAHADLRESYQGSIWNHACALRRVAERCPTVHVGVRSLCEEEVLFARERKLSILYAHRIHADPTWVDQALEALTDEVYLTIDVDGLDPSIMPATGTPEPGGLTWRQTTDLLAALARSRRIVALDVTELAPIPALHFADVTAAKLVWKTLSYMHGRDFPRNTRG